MRHRLPTSVEAFRQTYGHAPTVSQLRACIDLAHPPTRPVLTNGCDCYDPECMTCCDDNGDARTDNIRQVR